MAHVSIHSLEIPTITDANVGLPTSIRALMMAVLEDAIHCLTSPVLHVRSEAIRWMMSREYQYVFSYVVICETLKLDPSAVRRSIMRTLHKKVTDGRLLKRNRPNVRHGWALQAKTRRSKLAPHLAA